MGTTWKEEECIMCVHVCHGWKCRHVVAQDTGSPCLHHRDTVLGLGMQHRVLLSASPSSSHGGGRARLLGATAARLQLSVYFPGWKDACDPKALLCLARPLIHLQRKPMSAAPLCLPWAIALNLKGLGADFKGCSDKGCLNSTCVNNPWKTLWITSMKFSLNLLFFFSGSRKRWKWGKGGEEEGGRRRRWGEDPHFFLSANFSECQEVVWLKKWKRSLCYSHSFRNNLIRDLHVLKLLGTLNVRGHPCI